MKNAGRRDRAITVRQETMTVDDYGQPTVASTTDTTLWAEVIYPGNPSESVKSFQLYPERDVVFIVRHPNPTDDAGGLSITQVDTIVFEARDYDILGFEEIGRRDGLRIFCKEQGSDGR